MKNWFTENINRFLFAIPIGVVLSVLCVLGFASGVELNKAEWDWKAWGATMLGGVAGQTIAVAAALIIHYC